tara:strand:+ start:1740 stop:1874 length:135 start_codon:yes stop_codon:yes gene_type:complete
MDYFSPNSCCCGCVAAQAGFSHKHSIRVAVPLLLADYEWMVLAD